MGGVLLAPSSAPCLLPRSFTILCPGEAGAGHPHECQQRPEARARTGGRMGPQAGGGGSAPLPPGEGHHGGLGTAASGAGGARSRDSGLCVPSRSAVSPYVPFLARCWAGPKFGTKPTVCTNGETEAGGWWLAWGVPAASGGLRAQRPAPGHLLGALEATGIWPMEPGTPRSPPSGTAGASCAGPAPAGGSLPELLPGPRPRPARPNWS